MTSHANTANSGRLSDQPAREQTVPQGERLSWWTAEQARNAARLADYSPTDNR